MAAINQIIPVKIHLHTVIVIDGQQDEFDFHEAAELIRMQGGSDYLRYVEHQDGQATPVQLKLANGEIHLTRKGPRETNLLFKDGAATLTRYQTEYGMIPLQVETSLLDNQLDLAKQAGGLRVHYRLKNNEQLLGSYRLQLQFES